MQIEQLTLPIQNDIEHNRNETYLEKLVRILSLDFDFHNHKSDYSSHMFHSFPAKFPPQLPKTFISALTKPKDIVLDPMLGSGTTILEATLLGRSAVGFDIDPLALLVSQVKVTPLDKNLVSQTANEILKNATLSLKKRYSVLNNELEKRYDKKTLDFFDYWFAKETQFELLTLLLEIEKIADNQIRAFFELVFSSIIITKSGGVSLAFDLAHTRPHKAKVVISSDGKTLYGETHPNESAARLRFIRKKLRSAHSEFSKRYKQNLKNLLSSFDNVKPVIQFGNAEKLPCKSNSIDLIVTSPPYASNAIDYMRAHKFSLAWLGYPIKELGEKRKAYIGGEATSNFAYEELPEKSLSIVKKISNRNPKKGFVLHRYYSEMTRVLQELHRVLKPGKAAIIVVADSNLKGVNTETNLCLAEIGKTIGFDVPKIGVRRIDRNKRMLPASFGEKSSSQIQQRMHEEYLIGFYKPLD